MPILEIEAVMGPSEEFPGEAAQSLADLAGEILGANPGGTWVKLRPLGEHHYAESGGGAGGVKPVFISILLRETPSLENKRLWAGQVAEAAAQVFKRPVGNIHILYLPPGQGRVAFGGKLVE